MCKQIGRQRNQEGQSLCSWASLMSSSSSVVSFSRTESTYCAVPKPSTRCATNENPTNNCTFMQIDIAVITNKCYEDCVGGRGVRLVRRGPTQISSKFFGIPTGRLAGPGSCSKDTSPTASTSKGKPTHQQNARSECEAKRKQHSTVGSMPLGIPLHKLARV